MSFLLLYQKDQTARTQRNKRWEKVLRARASHDFIFCKTYPRGLSLNSCRI
ncbi:hypothetical protein LEP1GSC168_2659 [Leptospira santarosai str. HAI134]|nr:hypothetical protein LEP1GSC168_2659 [Leptospira santarosai str. HAI134]